jgi:hypothetical protein
MKKGIYKQCKICHKEFYCYPYEINDRKFCSSNCANKGFKGNIPWNKNTRGIMKSWNKGTKYFVKQREYKICPICKKEFTDKPYRMKVKKYCSQICASKVPKTEAQILSVKALGKSMKGIKLSLEHRKLISLAKTKLWQNEEYRKLKAKQMEKVYEDMRNRKPEEHFNWKGGKSFEEYGPNFTEELKKQIRQRDEQRCQECFRHQNELNKTLAVHHIDFNKKNNVPSNLISLCTSCHVQTNYGRDGWSGYFNNIMETRGLK